MKHSVTLLLLILGGGNLDADVRYVDAESPNPSAPYTSWGTAATTIQDAVDAAAPGDQVLVTNGVYVSGGRAVFGTMTNRVAIDRAISVESVNGPEVTIIHGWQVPGTTYGDGAIRCVYLTNGASLSGFTLTKGATRNDGDLDRERRGGGVWCESTSAVVSNCVLEGNAGYPVAYRGTLYDCTLANNTGTGAAYAVLTNCILTGNSDGGASWSTLNGCTVLSNMTQRVGGGVTRSMLNNCTLIGNVARGIGTGYEGGGGAHQSTLINCTVSSNSSSAGGGTYNSVLYNCTLTGNSATDSGGGAAGGTLNNCTLVNNSARSGGGASTGPLDIGRYHVILNNCTLISNTASLQGGGVDGWGAGATVNNCTLIGNSSLFRGGGADRSTLNNCIMLFNTAPYGENYLPGFTLLNYSCTTPQPTNGIGNITNAPLFVDLVNGNLRLQSNSPCINAGRNAYATNSTDLDGNARIVGGTVDIGAYEFQSPTSSISYAWLQQYGLPTDGTADFGDADLDGHNAWQEWRAWTDATDTLSALKLLTPQPETNGMLVRWQSVSGQSYFLERAADVDGAFSLLQSNIMAQANTTSITDTNLDGRNSFFYRVGVSE